MKNKCKHENRTPAGYIERGGEIRVQSMYHVFCFDCSRYISLLTGQDIGKMGLTHVEKFLTFAEGIK